MRQLFLLFLLTLMAVGNVFAQNAQERQKLFERVFGDAARLDPAQEETVLKDKPGKRHYVDRNNDGKPEEVWFIDLDTRHLESMRPVLVKVIDEDGDLRMGEEPDLDSDLYIADWKGDGTVDAITDYTDEDKDSDVDEMGIYFIGWKKQVLTCWWGKDIGDDNLLWHDVGYTYQQPDCQFRTHFGGNEIFSAYTIGIEDKEWQPGWENPFAFYDQDGDGVTEEVLRIEGQGSVIKNLRYSFDADNDATPDSPRDFDVSLSAHAPNGTVFDLSLGDHRALRGIPAGAFLAYQEAPKYALAFPWATYMLTWDENDFNTDGEAFDGAAFKDPQERWEGVIAKGNDFFKQIGGPSCGTVNKRFEVDVESSTPIHVYYSKTDQRIHLFGANHAWLLVDYNFDRTPDMRYDYRDADGDGYLDTWALDLNVDGAPDEVWSAGAQDARDVPYTFAGLNEVMKPLLETLPGELFQLTARLRQALKISGQSEEHPIAAVLESGFDLPQLPMDQRLRLLNSNETWRYYLDLLKDALIAELRAKHANTAFWNAFDAARAQGNVNGMRDCVEKEFTLGDALPDLDSFRAGIVAKYDHPRVAWAQDWVPPNIGWESEQAAYRCYWGQFDFFGKKCDRLIYPIMKAGESYHGELGWGIDALHVNDTCGLGGITLYVNGTPYPVYSPGGKGAIVWSKKLIEEQKDYVSIGLMAEHVGPENAPYTVRFTCSALKNRRDSPMQVTIDGGSPNDVIEVGLGIRKLPQELFTVDTEAGILANWGIQEPAIGWIGLGLVYPKSLALRMEDTPDEHQVIMRTEHGKPLNYSIQGTWLKGRRFDRCPTLSNWLGDLKETAKIAGLK